MTHKSIPTVVAALFAAALSAWTEPAAAQIPPSVGWTAQQAPAFYRFHLGDFRMTILSDGTASRDLSKIMSKPDAVRSAFWASHETLPVELSINCFLIDTGVQKILVDAGAGELFGSMSGRLVVNRRPQRRWDERVVSNQGAHFALETPIFNGYSVVAEVSGKC